MKNIVCFGAADGGKRLYKKIIEKYNILAFVDNDKSKWGSKLFDIPIYAPEQLKYIQYDEIIVTSMPGLSSICEQCESMGISRDKVNSSYVEQPLECRRVFLESISHMPEFSNLEGDCAEAGVFEGDFAKYINEYFPSHRLHLFDTFEGFDARDVDKEKNLSSAKVGEYGNTSEEKVLKKMPFPKQCIIHKGYFPQTAAEVADIKFLFVNLDLDLFEPTYQGLKFFSERMVQGGIILVHDYFADNFKGPRKAVDMFANETVANGGAGIGKLPIGDGMSILLSGF